MNNRIKKITCIALALILCLSAASCARPGGKGKANKVSAYNVNRADYALNIDASTEVHEISDLLYGAFFEDINFSADGGLYAEMIANRSFEFTKLAKDDQMFHWNTVGGAAAEVKIDDKKNALNANNTNYLVVTNDGGEPAGVENTGFMEGMAVNKEKYQLTVYAKALKGYSGGLTVRIVAGDEVIAENELKSISDKWEKYYFELEPSTQASENVRLQVLIGEGSAALDMVSLFPVNTYNNRSNGMRADLAGVLAAMQPRFLRFPGGCVIEGYDSATAYDWKASVGADKNGEPLEFNGTYGDVAARRQGVDLWTDINATDDEYPSFMSYGLGFYEYFLLAEDIGAVGVPVLNAGLYCQGRDGKAVKINSPEFKKYVQDMLDLVEFCRGDENTKWGKVRCSLGHEQPFELKYICIGNENFGKVYYERYSQFLKAFNAAKAKNPELYKDIELIYSSGGDDGLSDNKDHLKAFEYAKEQLGSSKNAKDFAGAIDSHYYNDPGWFLMNADYYDENNYKRSVDEMTSTPYGGAINVFVGEYASWSNNAESAISEAAYMTGLERNGDIVRMAAYAPLYSSVTARHWAPNLIWFNNSGVQPSVNYYIQQLFSTNAGTKLLKSELEGALIGDKDIGGMVGVGTWNTAANFDNIKVTDNETGEVIAEESFDGKNSFKKWQTPATGSFNVENGELAQTETEPEYNDLGSIAYFGDSSRSSYTYTFNAVKKDGSEGFFIPVAVKDGGNMFLWNIGGWDNTVSCLQQVKNGKKSGQLVGTVKDFTVETGKTYELKVEVEHTRIKCYIDGELYVDYDAASAEAEAYQVVSTDESGDVIIKLVNVTGEEKRFAVNISGAENISGAKAYQVSAESPEDENVFGEEEKVKPVAIDLSDISGSFNYTVPKYSATVIRISRN